jgi:hypothetical protein
MFQAAPRAEQRGQNGIRNTRSILKAFDILSVFHETVMRGRAVIK